MQLFDSFNELKIYFYFNLIHDGFSRPTFEIGTFLWAPGAPPASAASEALEELRKARIKRQQSTLIFICPRLMTPSWMKQLFKAADLVVFTLSVGCHLWPKGRLMFEPYLIGMLLYPFLVLLSSKGEH